MNLKHIEMRGDFPLSAPSKCDHSRENSGNEISIYPIEQREPVHFSTINSSPLSRIIQEKVAIEAPLSLLMRPHSEKSHRFTPWMITMRTPGLDPELAIGHLLSEGILSRELKELVDFFPLNHAVSSVPENPAQNGNNVFITLTPAAYQRAMAAKKRGPAHASCGVCSKTSSEQIRGMLKAVKPFSKNDLQVGSISPQTILRAPEILRSVQPTFALTGGTHGCALLKADGIVLAQAEDIGRHNAVDKLMGKVALNKDLKNLLEHKTTFLVLSGRVSFELIQKSIMSGIKTIVAVGAPSSYAIDLAKEFQMTLIGFVRDNRFNIYAGAERIYDNEKK